MSEPPHNNGDPTRDGELEYRVGPDGERELTETPLGQHQRWMRQAPDLYELYMAALKERDEARAAVEDASDVVDARAAMAEAGPDVPLADVKLRLALSSALTLAAEATNGWACYAKRNIEHDEITRLHEARRKLTALSTASPAPASPQGRELQDLRDWKKSALESLKKWHTLGEALLPFADLTLGVDIPSELTRVIPALLAHSRTTGPCLRCGGSGSLPDMTCCSSCGGGGVVMKPKERQR